MMILLSTFTLFLTSCEDSNEDNLIENPISYNKTGTENGKGYVDLGLSVKWAICNIGATSPEEYGNYFAWGETKPKTKYDWSTYKYCNGTSDIMTKYCIDSHCGIVDSKSTLELNDDAAQVNWGGGWRIPTESEIEELKNASNCTWTWSNHNGVNGYKVTSKKNGNSIFIPAAGTCTDNNIKNVGKEAGYWSSSLCLSYYNNYNAGRLYLDSYEIGFKYSNRNRGLTIRAVCQ